MIASNGFQISGDAQVLPPFRFTCASFALKRLATALGMFLIAFSVLSQEVPPSPGQTLWDYDTEFVNGPGGTTDLDAEGSAIKLHQKMMLRWGNGFTHQAILEFSRK